MRNRIMIVGRDIDLRAGLARILNRAGYRVELAENASHASRIGFSGIALAIIASNGLGPEGRGLAQELRAAVGPVLQVAAPGERGEPRADVIDATDEAGLLARVAEALARPLERDGAEPVLNFAGYRMDLSGHSLLDPAGKEVPLTHGEFGLLHAFVQRPGRVLSRDHLMQLLAGRDAETYDRSIDMQIARLRRKIESDPRHPSLILTIPGTGYKFAAKVDHVATAASQEPAASVAPLAAAPERRYVTALAAELVPVGGGGLPEDPEEMRALIDTYRQQAAAVIARHGGVMAATRVREVLAYFGYPAAQEHAVERALHAGLALVEPLPKGEMALPAGYAVRVGLASGLVVADPAGEVLGETPAEAARLQQTAEAGQVIVAAATRRLAGELFVYRGVDPRIVKGVGNPVQAWHLLGPSPFGSRSEAVHANSLLPLLGRDEELALLLRAWKRARSGTGRVVLLCGEPGIGKSRLLAALEEAVIAEPHTSLRYFCSPLHRESALHPVIARWEQELGFRRTDAAEERLDKLEAVLRPLRLPAEDFSLIAALLSVPTRGRYPEIELSPQRRKERTFDALHRRLEKLARERPVLMLYEDAQWADPSSLELLDDLLERLDDLPILLVISYRPEFVPSWLDRACADLVTLSRLDQHQSAVLAAHVMGGNALTQVLLNRIVSQSDGVPLFIEELTKAVLESLDRTADPARPLTVPGTLQASLMARLDRLPVAKQVAQIGASIGREFSYVLLAAVGPPEPQLTQGLDELVAAGLAFRRGAGPDTLYRFKHALVQEATYGTLLKHRRQEIHKRIGETLPELLPDRARTEPEVVAHHFTEAGLTEPAVEWWGKAGERALRRSAFVESISHLEKALRLGQDLGDGPAQRRSRLRLQLAYGLALRTSRGFAAPEASAAFSAARELATTADDMRERFQAYTGLWSGSFCRGELLSMQEIANSFLSDFALLPNLPETASAYQLSGMTRWLEGNFVTARNHLEKTLAMYDVSRDRELALFQFGLDVASSAAAFLALALWPLGFPDQARGLAERAVQLALGTQHPPTISYAHLYAAAFEMMCRDRRRAGPHAESLVNVAAEYGMSFREIVGTFEADWARWKPGDGDDGIIEMRKAKAQVDVGLKPLGSLFGTLLAEVEAAAGRPERGLAIVDAELVRIDETGQRWFLAEVHRTRGNLLAMLGVLPAAEAAFSRAIDVARRQSAKLFELRAASSLANLWCARDRRGQARDLLEPVYAWFTEGVESADLSEAKRVLHEVG